MKSSHCRIYTDSFLSEFINHYIFVCKFMCIVECDRECHQCHFVNIISTNSLFMKLIAFKRCPMVLLTSFYLDALTKSHLTIQSSNFIDTMYPSIGENKSSLNLSTVFWYSIKFKCCQHMVPCMNKINC